MHLQTDSTYTYSMYLSYLIELKLQGLSVALFCRRSSPKNGGEKKKSDTKQQNIQEQTDETTKRKKE